MNKLFAVSMCMMFLCVSVFAQAPGDYTASGASPVDEPFPTFSGSYDIGGGLNDFATIVDAVDALNGVGITGPTTFNVYPGTYDGQVYLHTDSIPGVSASNPLVFQGLPGAVVINTSGTSSATGYAFYLRGIGYVTIEDFEITNCHYGGIQFNYLGSDSCTHCSIVGNYIHDVGLTVSGYGIYATRNANCIIIGNEIDGSSYGIYSSYCVGDLYANNMLYGHNTCGMRIYGGRENKILYNTIYTVPPSFMSYSIFCQQSTNSVIKNNIFYNTGAASTHLAYYIGSDLSSYPLISDYNDIYAPDGTLGYHYYLMYTTLSDWQAATSLDLHSVSVDPDLVSSSTPIDLHLNSTSPLDGIGTPQTLVTDDFDGDPRDGTTPDIGADEFNLTSTNAGYISSVSLGPPHWGYRLNWVSGSLSQLVFTNYCQGTVGSLTGNASGSWSMLPNGDGNDGDSVIFVASTPLTSGSIDTFWLSHPTCSNIVNWQAGDSSGIIEGPLPVELTTFEATAGDKQVMLRWRTESETDNDHFVLYKRIGSEDFSMLAHVPGQGTTVTPHNYQFVDRMVMNGITYEYRIADVDINGVETIHDITVSATPSNDGTPDPVPLEYELSQNWPNPFNSSTLIKFGVKDDSYVTLKIFDLLGREITSLVEGNVSAGSYTVSWDATDYPSGIYMYQLEAGKYRQVRKLILMK